MIEIIPAIDIISGKCVRLSQGDYSRRTTYSETPSEMARRMADNGMTRIHAVDLDGAKAGKPVNLKTLESIASVPGVRVEWGGGLKTSAHVEEARNAGASYLVAGSIAACKPELFNEWLREFGPEVMVLGADLRNGKVSVAGWLKDTELTIDDILDRFMPNGLSQAIVTDISKDGMLQGPSFDLYVYLQEKYPGVDFTVSGGISSLDDIRQLDESGLRRVIVGKALYEGRITLQQLQKYIVDAC